MKKTILFSTGVALTFFLLSSFNVGTAKQTEKRCIKIKCGKKAHYELFFWIRRSRYRTPN